MKLYNLFIAIFLTVFTLGCSNQVKDPKKIISGESSRRWEAVKETNAEGKKEKLTEAEKNEVMQFNSNGTFAVLGNNQSMQGTWDYQEETKNLTMEFGNQRFSENFTLIDVKKDEMTLKAEDGSTLKLEAQEM